MKISHLLTALAVSGALVTPAAMAKPGRNSARSAKPGVHVTVKSGKPGIKAARSPRKGHRRQAKKMDRSAARPIAKIRAPRVKRSEVQPVAVQ